MEYAKTNYKQKNILLVSTIPNDSQYILKFMIYNQKKTFEH